MDVITGVTIAVGVATVCGTALAAIKFLKKPDKSWKEPVMALEKRLDKHEREINIKTQELEKKLVKVETHVEGIGEIKDNINKLDEKIDGLKSTILDWIRTRSE